MRRFTMRRLATTIVLLLLGLVPALADVRIVASPGGDVFAYLSLFEQLNRTGQRVVLDGPCLSACTLVLTAIPSERICVTSRAVLGFHAAQFLDTRSRRRYPAPDATRVLAATYPPAVQIWIEQHGGLSSKLILLRGRELAALYPRCA